MILGSLLRAVLGSLGLRRRDGVAPTEPSEPHVQFLLSCAPDVHAVSAARAPRPLISTTPSWSIISSEAL